ncbi:MAG: hypothetical protein R3F34_10170 [Planctomycetota bacterium]
MNRALRTAILLAVVATASSCAEESAPRSPEPAIALVLVDGVDDVARGAEWAAALGDGAVHGEAAGVSRSSASALASVLTSLDPAEHGLLTPRDRGAHTIAAGRSLLADLAASGATCLAATSPRELAPRVCELGAGVAHWIEAGESGPDAAFRAILPELRTALEGGGPCVALVVPTVVERPRAPWPEGLAADVERRVEAVLAGTAAKDRAVPPFDDLDAWYGRRWLGDPLFEEALHLAWHDAQQRAVSHAAADLAREFSASRSNWRVVVAGLRSDAMRRDEPFLDGAFVPVAVAGEPRPADDVPASIADLGALLRPLAPELSDRAPRRPSDGPFLVVTDGARSTWFDRSGRLTASLLSEEEELPPLAGLRLELAPGAGPVHVEVRAVEQGELHALRVDGAVVGDVPLRSDRCELDVAPGSTVELLTARRAPRLLLELSDGGRALEPERVRVAGAPLARVALPRVLDGRGDALSSTERSRRAAFRTQERGAIEIEAAGADAFDVLRWPPLERPASIEVGPGGTARVEPLGPGRPAVLVARDGRFLEADAFAVDGRAPEPSALRLLWPPTAAVPPDEDGAPLPPGAIAIEWIGPPVRFEYVPDDVRPVLAGLRSFE